MTPPGAAAATPAEICASEPQSRVASGRSFNAWLMMVWPTAAFSASSSGAAAVTVTLCCTLARGQMNIDRQNLLHMDIRPRARHISRIPPASASTVYLPGSTSSKT